MRLTSNSIRPNYHAPALEKGLDILEALAAADKPQTTADLARAINRTPSEIFRMMDALERREYIVRDETGCYRLSLKLYELSHMHTPFEEMAKAAARPMRALSDAIRESCHLAILDNDQLIIVAEQLSMQRVRLSVEIGSRAPALSTVSGRLLIANLPEDHRDSWLNRHPEFTNELSQIRKDGYSIAPSEYKTGTDIAVLVGNPDIGLMASLAVPCLGGGPNQGNEQRVLDALLECAAEINRVLCLRASYINGKIHR